MPDISVSSIVGKLTSEVLLAIERTITKTHPYGSYSLEERVALRKEIGGQFEKFAAYYAEVSGPDFDKTNLIRPYERKVLENIGLEGKSVLDTACGDLYYWRNYFELGASSLYGFDISSGLVAKAKGNIDESMGERVKLWEQSLDSFFQLADESIDVATNFLAIHYLDEEQLRHFFSEINRVLKKGGKLVVSTISPGATRNVAGNRAYEESIGKGEDLVVELPVPFGKKWIPTTYIARGYDTFERLSAEHGLKMAEPIEMIPTEEYFEELKRTGNPLDKVIGEVHRKCPSYTTMVFEKQ